MKILRKDSMTKVNHFLYFTTTEMERACVPFRQYGALGSRKEFFHFRMGFHFFSVQTTFVAGIIIFQIKPAIPDDPIGRVT